VIVQLKSRKRLAGVLAAVLLVVPAAAQARWLRGETAHFIVYSDSGERSLRDAARKLEDYDRLLRWLHGGVADQGAPKFSIYLVDGLGDLRQVFPTMRSGTAGVYSATPNGISAVAFKPGVYGDFVVKHEYYHHFMMQYFAGGYPAWMIEGLAEYFSTAQPFAGKMMIGAPRAGLMYVLGNNSWISLDELITKNPYQLKGVAVDLYYAQSWLLTNYMMVDMGRRAQLTAYVNALRAGKGSVEAWTQAVGESPSATQVKLRGYFPNQIKGYFPPLQPKADPAEVAVTTLPDSADDMLLEGQQLIHSLDPERRKALVAEIRADAAKHPGDRLSDLVVAYADLSFGDLSKAEAPLQRRLAADPNDAEALLYLAEARMRAGDETPERRTDLYREAGHLLARAFKTAPDDFRILYAYALTRSVEPDYPSDNTLQILQKAVDLGPQVAALRSAAADAYARRERYDLAIAVLRPMANDPHDLRSGQAAAAAIARFEKAEAEAKPKTSAAAH
jgi:cytochrome c-type biogenesis protein CcmH/NrfG